MLAEYGGVKLAKNDEEYLLLELLPAVANTFLRNKRKAEYEAQAEKIVETADKAATDSSAEAKEEVAAVTGPVFRAPMGGSVIEIVAKPGQKVKPGDLLLVYEAMKMENDLSSDMEGTIKRVLVKDGDVIATDQPLFEFE